MDRPTTSSSPLPHEIGSRQKTGTSCPQSRQKGRVSIRATIFHGPTADGLTRHGPDGRHDVSSLAFFRRRRGVFHTEDVVNTRL